MMTTTMTTTTTTTRTAKAKAIRNNPSPGPSDGGAMRSVRRIQRSLFLVASLVALAGTAHATLTPSEGAIIKQFVGTAQLANVPKVRSLVARTDLTTDESVQAMVDALAPLPLTEQRQAFLRDMIFGASSAPSRNVVVLSIVKGLIARADTIFGKANPDAADAGAELLRIYGFVADVANYGHPVGRLHDPQAGIAPATYEACAKALGEHYERHAPWLKGGPSQLAPLAARVRGQAQIALLDMEPDTPTKAVDAADKLGLDPIRRSILVERGLLVVDNGKADARVPQVQSLLRRVKGTTDDAEAIVFDEAPPELRARGAILAVKVPLDSSATLKTFPLDEVAESTVNAPVGELAAVLANRLVRQVLANRGDLRLAAQRDFQAANGDPKRLLGALPDASPEGAVAATLGLLLADGQRTMDVAAARFLAGRTESMAFVSDALGVLAAAQGPGQATQLALGKSETDGSSSIADVTGVRLFPSGAAAAWASYGTRWELTRDVTGTAGVSGVKRDAQPVSFNQLANVRVPVAAGTSWAGAGLALTPLLGNPLVGLVAGPRLRLVGTSEMDGVIFSGPGDDVVIETDVKSEGGGAILVRASSGRDGFGAGVRIIPGNPMRATLMTLTPNKVETPIGSLMDLPSIDHLRLAVKGNSIEVSIQWKGPLGMGPAKRSVTTLHGFEHGNVAVLTKKDASFELSNFTIRKN
jgi:hypothetical protein